MCNAHNASLEWNPLKKDSVFQGGTKNVINQSEIGTKLTVHCGSQQQKVKKKKKVIKSAKVREGLEYTWV